MRGLTEQEAEVLGWVLRAEDPRHSRELTPRELEIGLELVARGCISEVPSWVVAPDGAGFRRPITPLGRLALRVHEKCKALGVAA